MTIRDHTLHVLSCIVIGSGYLVGPTVRESLSGLPQTGPHPKISITSYNIHNNC